ncbi:branched-chain alpha-keto acid dehydrogenase subunit E2 [Massilia sp. WF1]|uniref:dihydrolipoamide acetyltransferase family protein n=1 Tax=unclassified Massilia TaxID=2609279 RepID=UPI00064963A4|nr:MULTISPECIES: dihydrolipoamide acetyltransferase family protein [unclassified Massilia]ALK98137.1 branched-chain alpha-keto acid dehydrogenase subunit E2 [Massilia sp. WG5]KLU35610.1 branched-chain alpha-keto acid dehydrogenase subunit E2 [Massilia sp. WF1]
MIEFKLPSLGSDMDQGKLLAWHVKPGDAVRSGQVVAVVDTSKAAVDVEAWNDGTVLELVVQPGETVPVGAVLATLLEPGETEEHARAAQRSRAAAVPPPSPAAGVAPEAGPPSEGRRPVSPAARRRAREAGIDIEGVIGTGPGGAVTLQDVENGILAASSAPAPADRQREMRKSIAAAMSRSKREIPHYYLSETVPMRRAQEWLAEANAARPITERLLMATLQLKAVALTLQDYPDLNGFFRDGAYQGSKQVHVGVAIALRQGGLVAPALHDVAVKPLEQLMRELSDLVRRARAGSLRSSEMSEPTITVTNLGEEGAEAVFGVIYPPQVALVGFGRIMERPWASAGGLSAMPVVTASLAADHRVSDGHRGAMFLVNLRERLQRPAEL